MKVKIWCKVLNLYAHMDVRQIRFNPNKMKKKEKVYALILSRYCFLL